MTTEEFICKAIEGGWRFPDAIFIKNPQKVEIDGDRLILIGKPTEDGWESKEYLKFSDINTDRMFLDPKAWEAVSKTQEWKPQPVGRQESDWGYDHFCRDCKFQVELGSMDDEVYKPRYEKYFYFEDKNMFHKDCPTLGAWKWNMHKMIDALCEGSSIEDFLKTL